MLSGSMIRVCAEGHYPASYLNSDFPDSPVASRLNPQAWLAKYKEQPPFFACILSFTETGLLPDISAAGASPQARRYTALADGEYLYGSSRIHTGAHQLPKLKAGVSPAVLVRAILTHCNIPLQLLSTGLPDVLRVPHISLPTVFAKPVSTGAAMTTHQAKMLFNSGYEQGQQLAERCQAINPKGYLVVGEAVVGGTTTAQAVLAALGYSVAGQMSSSHAIGNHGQKQALVTQGLSRWRSRCGFQGGFDPIAAAAAVGDPMQLVAAGIMLSASRQTGLLLAGGSQMLAVYALGSAIARQKAISWNPHQVVVGTTRWVTEDTHADTIAIARAVGAPYLASQLNFSQSPYFQLRAYEQGFVKEGTGLGGCAIAAHLYQNCTNAQLRHAIEAQLRQL